MNGFGHKSFISLSRFAAVAVVVVAAVAVVAIVVVVVVCTHICAITMTTNS